MVRSMGLAGRAACVMLVWGAASCDSPAPANLDAAAREAAVDADALTTPDTGADALAEDAAVVADADAVASPDADVPAAQDADVLEATDADAALDADAPTSLDADVAVAPDADAAVDTDAGAPVDAGPPRMTFTFVSAALSGGSAGGPQMRATITWHGALRGENDAGVRLEAFFR
jgi:hypothetical protein